MISAAQLEAAEAEGAEGAEAGGEVGAKRHTNPSVRPAAFIAVQLDRLMVAAR